MRDKIPSVSGLPKKQSQGIHGAMMEEIAWEPMAGDFADPVFCVTRQDFPPGKRIGMRAPP